MPDAPLPINLVKREWIRGALKEEAGSFLEPCPLQILAGTWNVDGTEAPGDLVAWLRPGEESIPPDVVLIGLQEVDRSAEAYVVAGAFKEDFWNQTLLVNLSQAFPDTSYERVASKLYVGIYAGAFIKSELVPHLMHVSTASAACGLMGLMGNKGAAGLRFRLYNDYICFISSHLAAHMGAVQRRNQDAAEIARRTYFSGFYQDSRIKLNTPMTADRVIDELARSFDEQPGPASIWDASLLIWAGDLNYRVPMDAQELKDLLATDNADLAIPLSADQLNAERAAGRAFSRFDEAPIAFRPTFKFDPGSSLYDSSEKNRAPAWCDRILYRRGDRLQPLVYDAVHSIRASDHRPVHCLFAAETHRINMAAFEEAYGRVLRKLDKFENELIPLTQLDSHTIDLGELVFRRLVRRSVEILNIGQVICQFRLIPKITSRLICKPWIRPRPSHGIILPGQSATLDFFFLADPLATAAFQRGDDVVEDIVVVHVEGGKDHFVSISGSFRPTPFCRPLASISETVVTEDPMTGQLKSVRKVPIPVWKLVDFLYQYGGTMVDGLFLASGYEAELAKLQDALDLDLPIEPALATEAGFLSAGELLLRFLDCLPDSVVPSDLYYGAIAICEDYAAAKELVSTMPIANIVLFEYLTAFLQYLVRKNRSFTRMDIAYVFAPILVKPPLDRGMASVSSVVSTQELRKQVLFLLLFL